MIHDYRITFDLSVNGHGVLLDVFVRAVPDTSLSAIAKLAVPVVEEALGVRFEDLPNVRVDDVADLGEVAR